MFSAYAYCDGAEPRRLLDVELTQLQNALSLVQDIAIDLLSKTEGRKAASVRTQLADAGTALFALCKAGPPSPGQGSGTPLGTGLLAPAAVPEPLPINPFEQVQRSNDVLSNIFRFLDGPLLLRAGMVCTRWREVEQLEEEPWRADCARLAINEDTIFELSRLGVTSWKRRYCLLANRQRQLTGALKVPHLFVEFSPGLPRRVSDRGYKFYVSASTVPDDPLQQHASVYLGCEEFRLGEEDDFRLFVEQPCYATGASRDLAFTPPPFDTPGAAGIYPLGYRGLDETPQGFVARGAIRFAVTVQRR